MIMIKSLVDAGAKALVAALALAAFAAAPALAVVSAPPRAAFGLTAVGSPSSIHVRGTAGRVLHGAVLLRNLSQHPIPVVVQRADIANAGNGNADFVTTAISGSGQWLHLSAGAVRLAPHASRRVTYAVSIPAATVGGSHYAGIVAFNAADLTRPTIRGKSKRTSFMLYRISRQALPLTIRLPGPLTRSLSLASAELGVQSAGASLVLSLLPGDAGGLGQLFPGVGGLKVRIPWSGVPTPGIYHVLGKTNPQGSVVVNIDQTIAFTAARRTSLSERRPRSRKLPGPAPPAGYGSH